MTTPSSPEQVGTAIIGAGQAGLSVGHHLKQRGAPFVILDANERIGDVWRNRWDSLRLFTPARFDGLDGMPFPAPRFELVTKDAMADYLESYAAHFELPVQTGRRVERLSRDGEGFLLNLGDRTVRADQVVVAMSNHQSPHVPAFAAGLAPAITQLHSIEYRNPEQLQPGGVLIVGAGNSGAEIARELAADRQVWLSGRDVGEVPFRIDGFLGRRVLTRLVLRGLFHRVLTVGTPMGRRMRPKVISEGGPLIRVKSRDLKAASVERVPRVAGTEDGQPRLEDGRVLDAPNVIWCTGFHPGFSWIDLPIHGEHEPKHQRGVADDQPGLYFVGLEFLNAMSSNMVHGVGRDAERIASLVADRAAAGPRRPKTGATAATAPAR
ncbi:MAG: NAD(P)-binding domain-containing protein [Chloroflexi bacterium]|nr:NAD(P)-binding domain-containing protein [Chloroflexota bacterium]MDA1146287.1 NAD(P)-binding domain-containing protein [Chloroflexota bacterium]